MPNLFTNPITGKGSWFGNAPGWYDAPVYSRTNSTASGKMTSTPGIALPNRATLGQMFQVTAPNGQTYTLPQIDVGPGAQTGRAVDISAGAAAQMGYTPKNFPTDSQFTIKPVQTATLAPASSSSSSFGDVISQARQVALQGGPKAVQQFMASQGYPQNGAWCGEFAASVIKSVGGTPPKNPEVASNWRNFGAPTSTPQPGDIAVRKISRFDGGPVPTGQVGSHVTFVENANPNNGTFTGLGGNQSNPESTFPLNQYEFRHPVQLASLGAPPQGQDIFGKPWNFPAMRQASPFDTADAATPGIPANLPPASPDKLPFVGGPVTNPAQLALNVPQTLNPFGSAGPSLGPSPEIGVPPVGPPGVLSVVPNTPASSPATQVAQNTPQIPQAPQMAQGNGLLGGGDQTGGANIGGILGALGGLSQQIAGQQQQAPAFPPPQPVHPQVNLQPLIALLQNSPLTKLRSGPSAWSLV